MAELKNWVTLDFRNDRLRVGKGSIRTLGRPKYVHLFVNEKDKFLFISESEQKDNDAFTVDYSRVDCDRGEFVISAKLFIRYLSSVIHVPYPSDSLSFTASPLEGKKTIMLDLKKYKVIVNEDKKG